MVYEGVSFRADIASVYTLDEFVNHGGFQQLWPELTDEIRKARLKEFYQLCEQLKIYIKQV